MPSNKAVLKILCFCIIGLAQGCSGGGSGPEPSSSDPMSNCTAQQGTNNQQASGYSNQQYGNLNQNQSMASAQATGGVYTLQSSSTFSVWGTQVATGDLNALQDLLVKHRSDIQATDEEYKQALALLADWAKGGSGNSAATAGNSSNPNYASANAGFSSDATNGYANPCF